MQRHLSLEEAALVREVTHTPQPSLYSLLATNVSDPEVLSEPLSEEAFDHFIDYLEDRLL